MSLTLSTFRNPIVKNAVLQKVWLDPNVRISNMTGDSYKARVIEQKLLFGLV